MEFLINALVAIIIASLIGSERAASGKAIGVRSIALVLLGAFSFTWLSCDGGKVIDWHVIAQIVTGVGFIGSATVIKDNSVHNLTTAILVWTMAAVGVLIGLNKLLEAITLSILIYMVLLYKKN